MNTYLAASLADDRRRQYVSDAAVLADAFIGLRAERAQRTAAAVRTVRAPRRRPSVHPVRAFRTWLAAGLL